MKFLLIFFFSLTAFSFTLNNNIDAGFESSEVKIYITSNSVCENTGTTRDQMLDYAVQAANRYWNTVPTSRLKIISGGILETDENLFLTGELCLESSTTSCNSSSIPPVTDIVIACNNENTSNFKTNQVYGIAQPNNFNDQFIKGSVILINNALDSQFNKLSIDEKITILGHEIGHAIGLGHQDQITYALMFPSQRNQVRLAQDDADGVSYLYPVKIDSCGLFGTVLDKNDKNLHLTKRFPFIFSFIAGFLLLFLIVRLLPFRTVRSDIFYEDAGH